MATYWEAKKKQPHFKEDVCTYCNETVVVPSHKPGPSVHPECKLLRRKDTNRRRNNARRKFTYNQRQNHFGQIAERDDWTCWICKIRIDPDVPSTNRMGATIDHVIPISKGGTNDHENLKLAHWICNVRRGNDYA